LFKFNTFLNQITPKIPVTISCGKQCSLSFFANSSACWLVDVTVSHFSFQKNMMVNSFLNPDNFDFQLPLQLLSLSLFLFLFSHNFYVFQIQKVNHVFVEVLLHWAQKGNFVFELE